jgi:hypothetical protein
MEIKTSKKGSINGTPEDRHKLPFDQLLHLDWHLQAIE